MPENLDWEIIVPVLAALIALFSKLLDVIILKIKPQRKELTHVEYNYELNKNLWLLLTELDADRAYICRFHNGGYFSGGIEMKKFSMTNEVFSERVEGSISAHYKDKYISEYAALFAKLFINENFLCENQDEIVDPSTKNLLKKYPQGSFYLYIIKESSGKPIAYFGIHFNKGRKLTEEEQERNEFFAKSIAPLVRMQNLDKKE